MKKFLQNHQNRSTFPLFIIFIILVLLNTGCKTPVHRSGNSYNGSLKWAYDIAEPLINDFSSDAGLYNILGMQIWKDGRLPSNTGTWSFVTWSSSLRKKCQVTITNSGSSKVSITDKDSAPGTGNGTTIPEGWVNSTVIFSAIPSNEITKDYAQLLVLNITSYNEASGEAVWGINFAGGRNPLVKWDGTYIGTQGN